MDDTRERNPAGAPQGLRTARRGSPLEVLRAFLALGLTSFGGPVAHLGYFRAAFVERRQWLSDRAYADLVALCQFLPGPASSQVGIGIGLSRAGLLGALAAWLGFTLPSAALMIAFAYGVAAWGDALGGGWLHGLKLVAVAVVAQAVLGMLRSLCPDRPRQSLAVAAAVLLLAWPSVWAQLAVIAGGGLAGWLLYRGEPASRGDALPIRVPRWLAPLCLALFALLLVALPLWAEAQHGHALAMVDAFYRTGSLVFGGGHVVLPLLEAEVVPTGWVDADRFLAGYGAAQAVPGPLFSFAAYLGAAMTPAPNGWVGGTIALLAIYLPSFLLLIGALPYWERLRRRPSAQATLKGVNAAVVGLLAAAFYDPVFLAGVRGPLDAAAALALFLLLTVWKLPLWLAVLLGAALGAGMAEL